MADWPLLGGQLAENAGADYSACMPTLVTSGSVAHTKGDIVELIAATSFDSSWLIPNIRPDWNGHLIDIMIGPDGSEEVLIPNLLVHDSRGFNGQVPIPVCVPAGSRLGARSQCNSSGGHYTWVQVILAGQGLLPSQSLGVCQDVGTDLSTSRGTLVAYGGTPHVKGDWQALSPVVARDSKWILVAFAGAAVSYLTDIGIGSEGSEEVIIPNLQSGLENADPLSSKYYSLPANIPAGSTISVRFQAYNNANLWVACYSLS